MSDSKLSSSDAEFFALVSRAAFHNPFTAERAALDLQIACMGSDGKAGTGTSDLPMAAVLAAVKDRLRALPSADGVDLRRYRVEDQAILRHALLFDLFHHYAGAFDAYIVKDLSAGDASVPVPFAREALDRLAACGFESAAALGYFALFYQMRRAFFFIDQALTGATEVMKAFRQQLWNSIFSHRIDWYERHLWNRMEDYSTLILGETGTGKGAAAASIGRSCFIPFDENKGHFLRSISRTFVSINLSQFPETLIESELFGHRKGAFTGAVDHFDGVLSRCCPHGVLFLDEIGELATTVQIKLLHVLQERQYTPVGSHEQKRFHGRVIAATNRSPAALRGKGGLRDDFYYRLCANVITAPTLRERLREDPDELEGLAKQLVQRQIGSAPDDMLSEVLESLRASPGIDYPWPGNVRELGQAIRRILLSGQYEGDAAGGIVGKRTADALCEGMRAGTFTTHTLLAKYCAMLYRQLGTYGEVARRTGLDWRTVKKYVERKETEE